MAALKNSLHLVWRALRIGLLVAVSNFALILLTLRYWILPGVERYHDRIADSISAAINRPVSIGQIEADWRGLRPRLLLRDVRIKDEAGQD
ncbi:MAG: hypothetical protein LBE50_06690, partial [Gallionellaceae bacterium]|nr:hypothetical protein [Gallionellaceae bacterium]